MGSVTPDFLSRMVENGPCDVLLRIEDVQFVAHKTVLSACSPVFKKMFNGERFSFLKRAYRDQFVNRYKEVIEVSGVEPDIFREALIYFYCDDTRFKDHSMMLLFEVADLFQSNPLKLHCAKHMQAKITLGFCLTYWKFADENQLASLMLKAQKFIITNINHVKHGFEFEELEVDELTNLIANEEVVTNALPNTYEMIYTAIKSWINHLPRKRIKYKLRFLKLFDLKKFTSEFMNTVVKRDEQIRKNKMANDWFLTERFLRRTSNSIHRVPFAYFDETRSLGKQLLIVDGRVDNYGFIMKYQRLFQIAPRTPTPVSSVMAYNDKIYLLAADERTPDLEYDLNTDIWNTKSFGDFKFYTGAILGNCAYLAGGSLRVTPEVHKYCFETDMIMKYQPMRLPRAFPSFTAHENSIFACGGIHTYTKRPCSKPEIMDTRTGFWEFLPRPKHQYGSCTATMHEDKLYVCNKFTGDIERFELRFPRWDEMPRAPGPMGSIVSCGGNLLQVSENGIMAYYDVLRSWRCINNFDFITPTVCPLEFT